MLKKPLEFILVPLILLYNYGFVSPQPIQPYINKPQHVHSQASEGLDARLLAEADKLAKANPLAAIPLYKMVIAESDGTNEKLKEEAIEKAGNTFFDYLFKKSTSKWILESALNYFDEVTNKHPGSRYVPKAHRGIGIILAFIQEQKDVYGGVIELKKAYELSRKIGDVETELYSAWNLAMIGIDKLNNVEKTVPFQDTIFYLTQVSLLAKGTTLGNSAEQLLKKIGFENSK